MSNNNIKNLIDLLDMSLEAVALDLGISKSYLHQLKSGKAPLPEKIAYVFAVQFNVHPLCLTNNELPLMDCTGALYDIKSLTKTKHRAYDVKELNALLEYLTSPADETKSTINACLLSCLQSVIKQMDIDLNFSKAVKTISGW